MPLTDQVAQTAMPPNVPRRDHRLESTCAVARMDPYFWLRDDTRQSAEIIDHLENENRYANQLLEPLTHSIATLDAEMAARLKPDDVSVPFLRRGWWYYTRYRPGEEYPLYVRQEADLGVDARSILHAISQHDFAKEQVLLDANALAQGHPYFAIGQCVISPDSKRCAWTQDTLGRRQYTLFLKDIQTGVVCQEQIHSTAPDVVWADDNQTLFYLLNDEVTLLTKRVMKHRFATSPQSDSVVYNEADDSYYLSLARTRDERFILIYAESTDCNEVRYFPADLSRPLAVMQQRQPKHEYYPDHFAGRWIIRTNTDGAYNYKLVTAATQQCDQSHWREWLAHDPDSVIENIVIHQTFIAMEVRTQCLVRIIVMLLDGQRIPLQADEPAYTMELEDTSEPSSSWLRYRYTSLTTPETVYAFHVETNETQLLKQQSVPGYIASAYLTERIWVRARDGENIPVTLVSHKKTARNGQAALYLYAYGSYGVSTDPHFDLARLSLLDRGCVFAIAHVRGGSDLGRQWYEAGRQHTKKNTFHDFIDVTKALVARGYAAAQRVVAAGGSAGGLLMGVVANEAPELYTAIVAHVPFVDVVTTMCDASLPLTTNEYEEWGDPTIAVDYEAMLAYSPYDNVAARPYPAFYITTGFYDSQVQYWEPVKWVAKLRHLTASHKPIICRVHMAAGHSGHSGRLARYHDYAEEYAFVLDHLGCLERSPGGRSP